MNTALFYSPKFLEHDSGPNHPETARRLKVIVDELSRSSLLKTEKCAYVEPKQAHLEDLRLVHERDYIRLVEKTCASGGGILDLGDTVVSSKSYEAATVAVGAVIDAVDLVLDGRAKNAFALVRPPGHHAGAYYALGFCLFNNVAVAASYLLRRRNLERVLILDVDAHHGNGTQEIFYNTDKVLYISLHEDPKGFPGTGFVDEIGEGDGIGYTVNVPFPFRTGDAVYERAFDEVVAPISSQFKPKFILVSAGFDGHYTDPVGALSLSMKGYEEIFSRIVNLAGQLCDGRLVATLEGGYSLNFLGKMATAAIAKMANASYRIIEKNPAADPKVERKAEQVISSVKKIQSTFWKLG